MGVQRGTGGGGRPQLVASGQSWVGKVLLPGLPGDAQELHSFKG